MQTKDLKIPLISLEHIPRLWGQNDVLIFLVDLDDYGVLDTEHLDGIEKEYLERLKTAYFKKRYIVSRMVLKCVLCRLLKEKYVSDISMYKDEYGKIHTYSHEELHLCISYTENIVALAVSKVEVGIDVEFRKKRSLSKISKFLHNETLQNGKSENNLDILTRWTLNEAYCKFSNESVFSTFTKELNLNNLFHSSHIIDKMYILTIITGDNRHMININRLQKIDCR